VETKFALQSLRRCRHWQRRCRNHSLPPQQLQQSLQSGYIVSCWTSTACSRAKVWPKQPNGNVLRPDSTLGQPAAEIGDQTGLQLSRMPGITLTTHLSIVGLEIRTQGPSCSHSWCALKTCFIGVLLPDQTVRKAPPDYAGKIFVKPPPISPNFNSPGIVRDP